MQTAQMQLQKLLLRVATIALLSMESSEKIYIRVVV